MPRQTSTLPPGADDPQPHRVVLYYPAKQRDGTPVDMHETLAQGLELLLCREMGGVTRYPAVGNYTTGSGAIHREKVEVLEVYCETSDWERQRRFLEILARKLALAMNQESIALAIDGRLFLIAGHRTAKQSGDFSPLTNLTPAGIADVLGKQIDQKLRK